MRRPPIRVTDLSYLVVTVLFMLITQSCLTGRGSDDHGEVVGVPGRTGWKMETPRNMVFIPGGSFVIGAVDQDIASLVNPEKQVAVSSLYVDKCQITNNQYRQFIDALLEEAATAQETQNISDEPEEYDTSSVVAGVAMETEENEWSVPSKEFIMEELYPDMRVWEQDFAHHMADRMVECYYDHPSYDNFPVVGITWDAAKYFSEWRTKHLNAYREDNGLWGGMPQFRLPTAAEWTYVARGGKAFAKYPWGGPYVRNAEGELLANFKSSRGNYRECVYDHIAPVDHFAANDYGLHIGGNVSEWTLDAYNPASSAYVWDLNPIYHDEEEPRKIIKGGSWKDIARFLQTDAIDYEYQDKPRSYIGFRCVMPHIGEESTKKKKS